MTSSHGSTVSKKYKNPLEIGSVCNSSLVLKMDNSTLQKILDVKISF